jgi:hypothetical protein
MHDDQRVSADYDCLAEAEAAMKRAVATKCPHDRLRWVRAAQVWLDLCRFGCDARPINAAPEAPATTGASRTLGK